MSFFAYHETFLSSWTYNGKQEVKCVTTVALFYDNVRTINEYTKWYMHGDVIDLAMRLTVKNRMFEPQIYDETKAQIKRHTHMLSKARYDRSIQHALFARAHCESSIADFVTHVFTQVRILRDFPLMHRAPIYQAAMYYERTPYVTKERLQHMLSILQRFMPQGQSPSPYHAAVLAKMPTPLTCIEQQFTRTYHFLVEQQFAPQYVHVTAMMACVRQTDLAQTATNVHALKMHIEKTMPLRPVYDSYMWIISTTHDAWTAIEALQQIEQQLRRLPVAFPQQTDMMLLSLQLLSATILDHCETVYESDIFNELLYDFTTVCDDSGKSDTACTGATASGDSSDGGGGGE